MKGMLAQLSPHEETALRKIAVGSDDPVDPAHVRRLEQLELVEKDGCSWRLTALGGRRHDLLISATMAANASAA
jgi:hypothetical protein